MEKTENEKKIHKSFTLKKNGTDCIIVKLASSLASLKTLVKKIGKINLLYF